MRTDTFVLGTEPASNTGDSSSGTMKSTTEDELPMENIGSRSVKPGVNRNLLAETENDRDVTWLDILITMIEKKIKELLQWEL
jgi:hypothetical protein